MKKVLMLLISIVAFAATHAQVDEWKILMNKQLLLSATSLTEDPVITIPASAFKTKKIITVEFKTKDPQDDWKRIFHINDKGEKNIKTLEIPRPSGSVSFTLKTLQQYADKKQPVYIYTLSIPKDPDQAAVVRVRRVLVCKIMWR